MRSRWFSSCQCCVYFILVLLNICHLIQRQVSAWHVGMTYGQRVEYDNSCCFGGEPFPTQPVVHVVSSHHQLYAASSSPLTNFSGTLSVELYQTEKMIESGVRLRGESCIVSIENGTAVFNGLLIYEAGHDYRLHFILRDNNGRKVAFLIGERFSVNVGPAYQIGIIVQPDNAFGGSIFGQQPIVAVQDRGFNIIPFWNEGTVKVSLFDDSNGSLKYRQESVELGLDLPVLNGIVPYHFLYINEVGIDYRLLFEISVPLKGPTKILSNVFEVQIGPPSQLLALDDPSLGKSFGGEAFERQPRIAILDAGGNLVSNSSLSIRVEVDKNYLRGDLVCASSHRQCDLQAAKDGIAQFSGLTINIAGSGYRLRYSLEATSIEPEHGAMIYIVGPKFNVFVGKLFGIQLVDVPAFALANNQPFQRQPVISFVDRGGNTVQSKQPMSVSARLTPSLSMSSRLVINTKSSNVPTISSVIFDPTFNQFRNITVGPGDVVPIIVVFTDEVFINDGPLPYLELNVIDPLTSANINATLAVACRRCRLISLTFNYFVREGHNVDILSYRSINALASGNGVIIDVFQRPCTLELPNLSGIVLEANHYMKVSDETPVVVGVGTSKSPGEYGAGEVIDIVVNFSRKVSVGGVPKLPISIASSMLLIDTYATGIEISPGSFFYISFREEVSESIPWNATRDELYNAIKMLTIFSGIPPCVDRSTYTSSTDSMGGFRWVVRSNDLEKSDFYMNDFGINFEHMRSTYQHTIEMKIGRICVNGPYNDWLSGDMCTRREAPYVYGSGSSFLSFRYSVFPGDMSPRLEVEIGSSLLFDSVNDTVVLSTFHALPGAISADCSLNNSSLPLNVAISIDTSTPLVESVTFAPSSLSLYRFAVGDTIDIGVEFSKPVSVRGYLELKLDVGAFSKPAPYIAGNGTSTLLFRHRVESGQYSEKLEYYGVDALRLNIEHGSYIRRLSTNPIANADRKLPLIGSPTSLSASASIVVDGIRPEIVSVGFEAGFEGKTYFTGDIVLITVSFSAPILVIGGPPVITILTGNGNERQIPFIYGNQTSTLVFEYKVQLGDFSNYLAYKYDTDIAFCSSETCNATNETSQILQLSSNSSLEALLTLPLGGGNVKDGVVIGSGDIRVGIDGSGQVTSTILSVQPLNSTGLYGPGDFLCIDVITSDLIFVQGNPYLKTNLQEIDCFLSYWNGSGTTQLTFCKTLSQNDSVKSLEWSLVDGTESAILCEDIPGDKTCLMTNIFGIKLNTDFVDNEGIPSVSELSTISDIEVNSVIPIITTVKADKWKSPYCSVLSGHCFFSIGEIINILVTFDFPVMVTSSSNLPYILMDVCDNETRAVYNETASQQDALAFTYIVSAKHQTINGPLTYICRPENCRIQSGNHIMRKATFPILQANSTLPKPNELGVSEDQDNQILVRTDYAPSIINVSTNSCYAVVSPGDIVDIFIHFDQAVVVTGNPYLELNVGAQNAYATYVDGSNSTELSFRYEVYQSHVAFDLDYNDSNSIRLPGNSSILMASSLPQIDADLRLPIPGKVGSISFNCDILVDGSTPYITSISASPNEGNFSTGDVIEIYLVYSADISVFGSPSLTLETGEFDRNATYSRMMGNNTLVFSYAVQLGDMSRSLDYWVSESNIRSSASSLQLNGGWIRRKSRQPTLDANNHLNPSMGVLSGTTTIDATDGLSRFTDLRLSRHGFDYEIVFATQVPTSVEFQTSISSMVRVEPSAEYQLVEGDKSREANDLFGKSVSIQNELMVVGAPFDRVPSPEVQTLTITCDGNFESNEVHSVTVSLNKTFALTQIWRLSTSAVKNGSVNGYFNIAFVNSHSYIIAEFDVPSDIGPTQLSTYIENVRPDLIPVKSSRRPNDDCECTNAWIWDITFTDSLLSNSTIEVTGDDLSGSGAKVNSPVAIKGLEVLDGTFSLKHDLSAKITRPIPYNASSVFLREVLEMDLGLPIARISSYNTDEDDNRPELGRTWIITYAGIPTPNGVNMNVTNIFVHSVDLDGSHATTSVLVKKEGFSRLGGVFSLSLQNDDFTTFIPFDASNITMAAALEKLNVINNVLVDGPHHVYDYGNRYGNRWFITFISINVDMIENYNLKESKYCKSDGCNIGRLNVYDSALFGNNVQSNINFESGIGSVYTRAQELQYKKGDAGIHSGSVTVYERFDEQIIYEAKVTSHDADSFDLFGFSVSLSKPYLLIGAPGKENSFGAQFGAAYLFRRFLDCSTTICNYKWSEEMKFTPPEMSKNAPEFGYSVAVNLSQDPIVAVGAPSANEGRGEVYVFRTFEDGWKLTDILTSLVWNNWKVNDRFGEVVRISNRTILVGSPGTENSKGAVYSFVESQTNNSKYKPFLPNQMIQTDSTSSEGFGKALDIDQDHCVICAPYALDRFTYKTGTCYVYSRISSTTQFKLQQVLVPSFISHNDQFGIDVAMNANRIIVGQVRDIEHNIHCEDISCSPNTELKIRGKSHVFDLVDDIWEEKAFLFPSQYQPQDMFGSPVAIHKNLAIVGSSNRALSTIHSGSAVIFDLTLLDFSFQKSSYDVVEGEDLTLSVSRKNEGRKVFIYVKSMDRNAVREDQQHLNDLFSFRSTETFPNSTTIYDLVYHPLAFGREQWKNSSYFWLNGMYDIRGIGDYETLNDKHFIDTHTRKFDVTLHTLDDEILESPDENFTVLLFSPGVIASQLGSASTKIIIKDNDDANMQYSSKILPEVGQYSPGELIETSVDYDDFSQLVAVGRGFASIKDENGEILPKAGIVYIYKYDNGHFILLTHLTAGIYARPNGYFGLSIAIKSVNKRRSTTILVSCPGQNQVNVYNLNSSVDTWQLEGILSPSPTQSGLRSTFGQSSDSISLYGDLAFIGNKSTETVHVYRRTFQRNHFQWSLWQILRSPDFKVDIYDENYTVEHMHVQQFGSALAYSNRTLLVGAPFANYRNRGNTTLGGKYSADGIEGLGRGKVFLFVSLPYIQKLSLILSENETLTSGSFRVILRDHKGISNCTSLPINHNASSGELKIALVSMPCIEEIEVSKTTLGLNSSHWSITFLDEIYDNFPLLEPTWFDNGCSSCSKFMSNNVSATFTITTHWQQKQGNFTQVGSLENSDSGTSDLFGSSISLDGSLAIIGARTSGTRTRTTWDFETGSLTGWTATGTSFDLQPTFGDNSMFRKGYKIQNYISSEEYESPKSSSLRGRFYIGTYEKRPCKVDDYMLPHDDYPEGSFSGDEPTGTLTSDGFVIFGNFINFLIGGGCDHLIVYVELLIDGFPSMSATGKCSEQMNRVEWNVEEFLGRTAQIRIVDSGSDKWHHINVDDFQFSWSKMEGPSGGALPTISEATKKFKQHFGGHIETSMAGVAYLFKKSHFQYEWIELQRLEASDKREGNMFGNAVAINDKLGIAVVGSSHSPALGFYQEVPSRYPHYDEDLINFPINENLENYARAGNTLAATGGNLRLINHVLAKDRSQQEPKYNKHAGVIYVFTRSMSQQNVESWKNTETAKISPPDISSLDYFGTSIAMHNYNIIVGAKRWKEKYSGAIYFFDLKWIHISFTQQEYHVIESDGFINITLSRSNLTNIASSVSIGYFTSDLTAKGIDSDTFDACTSNNTTQYSNLECGDYEQSNGIVVFDSGATKASFRLRIMDDFCKEENLKYFQLQLKILGGGACIGENFRAQVRIDDDDWTSPSCSSLAFST